MEAQSLPYDVLKSVFECMSDGVAAFDEHGRILYCNPALAVLTGRPVEQLLGRTPMDAWGGRAASSYDSLTLSLSEERVVTQSGLTRHLSVRTVSLSEKGVARVLLYRDVTRDKTKTIQRIQQSDERYRQLVETVRVIPWEMRPGASCFSYVGPQARKITGHATDLWYHDEFLRHVLAPNDLEQLHRVLSEPIAPSESREFEFRMNSAYGTRLWFRAVASLTIDNELQPVIRGFLFDVTDLREAEERGRAMETRMLQSQKLESLGLLASGIAHDFNNLLMAILGNASLALLEMDESQKPHRFVKQVEVAATRASELTRELLNYSGKGRFVFKAVSLSSLVREMGEILQSVISKRATVRYEIADKLPPIDADASQIR
jgi:two-component system cell cycle sensor histidine kinase/response regulator CckA